MEHLTVIGSGTMGHSIVLNAAWAGIKTKMYGFDEGNVTQGLSEIKKKLGILLENRVINNLQSRQIIDRITATSSLNYALDSATFIIEAIPEDAQLKNLLFIDLDKKCRPEVILTSTTSGLSLEKIALGTIHPSRILITHFWNPAHLIPLVEVLKMPNTSAIIFRRVMDLLTAMHKKAIEVKKEVPGLIGNRLQFALFREAQYLLEEGIASKEDIDAAVTNSIGRRLSVTGPLMSADMGGLDTFRSISNYLFKDLSDADYSFSKLEKLVQDKKLGTKSGEGYYKWDVDFSERVSREREQELIRLLKAEMG